jgi:hypothetical protein
MPYPIIGPVEQPVAGVRTFRRSPRPPPLLHGGTSLRPSDPGIPPVLDAHPGSPVDLSKARRPSLAASLKSAHSYGSDRNLSWCERPKAIVGKKEELIGGDDVAAKYVSPLEIRDETDILKSPRKQYMSAMQPISIPAKVPEDEQVQITTTALHSDDNMSMDTVMEDSNEDMDFQFDAVENGTWIAAHPLANGSKASLATSTTAASTIMGESTFSQYGSQGPLTIDTSVGSSSPSVKSNSPSTYSVTPNPSDIYGWEEELERQSSTDTQNPWESDTMRRLPNNGRTPYSSFSRRYDSPYRRTDGKRKSLLYRVLNLHGRRSDDQPHAETEAGTLSAMTT